MKSSISRSAAWLFTTRKRTPTRSSPQFAEPFGRFAHHLLVRHGPTLVEIANALLHLRPNVEVVRHVFQRAVLSRSLHQPRGGAGHHNPVSHDWREAVVVPGGKVADVQRGQGEARDLHDLSLREEPIGNSALIEDLDRARVQTAGTRAGEVLSHDD
jgi:hypothetical protein